jgi:putative pyruvate formate lyase activating enzyme
MAAGEQAGSRLAWAQTQQRDCRLCPRACRVNRLAGHRGWCGAGPVPRCFQEFVNYSEEPELTPSHAVLLTGCNLGCLFCHTVEGRQRQDAPLLTRAELQRLAAKGRAAGARNLNLYGGEPFVNLPGLLALFAESADLPPVVWNTNLYCSAEALAAVAGIPSLYLVDLKFGGSRCAAPIAGSPDYWDVLTARLLELRRDVGAAAILVRHLVMPGHLSCCTEPVLRWLAANLADVRVSLRTGYLVMPPARADADLGRFLTAADVATATALAQALGLALVEAPVPGVAALQAPAGQAPGTPPGAVDVEVVLSPGGQLYLRNAPREILELSRRLAGETAAIPP